MSRCNIYGRPPQDNSFQNLTVNDTLRIQNALKSTKAEISRVCALTGQKSPINFSGVLKYTGEGSSALNLFAFPSGTTLRTTQVSPADVGDFWFTSEQINKITFQVDAISTLNTELNVSLMFSETPTCIPVDVITVPLTLTASTIASDIYVISETEIQTGSFITIQVTSTATSITNLEVSWTIPFYS